MMPWSYFDARRQTTTPLTYGGQPRFVTARFDPFTGAQYYSNGVAAAAGTWYPECSPPYRCNSSGLTTPRRYVWIDQSPGFASAPPIVAHSSRHHGATGHASIHPYAGSFSRRADWHGWQLSASSAHGDTFPHLNYWSAASRSVDQDNGQQEGTDVGDATTSSSALSEFDETDTDEWERVVPPDEMPPLPSFVLRDLRADDQDGFVTAESDRETGAAAAQSSSSNDIPFGSRGHATGTCRPCAHFWKPNGCSKGDDCERCHLCDENAFALYRNQYRKQLTAKRTRRRQRAGQRRRSFASSTGNPWTSADSTSSQWAPRHQ